MDVFCDRCGKKMNNDGTTLIGISIEVLAGVNADEKFVQEQLGKYEIGRKYSFCAECYIDAYKGEK